MHNHAHHNEEGDPLPEVVTTAATPEELLVRGGAAGPLSPLGWNIWARLGCTAAALGLLWLAVAWAIGWWG